MPNSAALRQGSHFKIAKVASCWQRVEDLIGSGFEPHTSRAPEADGLPFVTSGRLFGAVRIKNSSCIKAFYRIRI